MLSTPLTQAEVIAVAGELNTGLTSDQWTLVLLRANTEIDELAMGSAYRANMVARYYAAHVAVKLKQAMAAGAGTNAPAGPVSQVSVGAVSKSYDTSAASMSTWSQQAEDLRSTLYGREALRLMRLWAPRAIVV